MKKHNKSKNYYGPIVTLKSGKKKREKWCKGHWYTLCQKHFGIYKNFGGYCKADKTMRCSICPNQAFKEFYPEITHQGIST